MKAILFYIPKAIIKLLAVLFTPVIHLFTCLYQVMAFLLSYSCIGLCLICLLAAAAEFINVGVTKEAFAYITLSALSYTVRWIVLHSLPFLYTLQEIVEEYAAVPIRDHYTYADSHCYH